MKREQLQRLANCKLQKREKNQQIITQTSLFVCLRQPLVIYVCARIHDGTMVLMPGGTSEFTPATAAHKFNAFALCLISFLF